MPSNLTTIPAPRVPLTDANTGLIATEWYRFLFNLYTLSGSGSNIITLDELQIGPPTQPTTTTGGGGGGSGTVTSVATGAGLSGGPITTTGTINFAVNAVGTWAATPSSANLLAAMTDETGTGSLVFATSPTLVTPILGTPTSGNFSTGTFTWPTFNQNTTGTASNVTGTVAIANGGTGQTTASAAFNALSPITTTGDLILGNGTNSATRLAIGANTYVLTSNGTTASWQAASGGGSNITSYGLWENANTISANYTIATGNNAQSAGPITINTGVTVTVPTDSTWVIV